MRSGRRAWFKTNVVGSVHKVMHSEQQTNLPILLWLAKRTVKPDERLCYLGDHDETQNVGGTNEESIRTALSINGKAYPYQC